MCQSSGVDFKKGSPIVTCSLDRIVQILPANLYMQAANRKKNRQVFGFWRLVFAAGVKELELELIQARLTQNPMLRVEVNLNLN